MLSHSISLFHASPAGFSFILPLFSSERGENCEVEVNKTDIQTDKEAQTGACGVPKERTPMVTNAKQTSGGALYYYDYAVWWVWGTLRGPEHATPYGR